jgi:hypothetical protein
MGLQVSDISILSDELRSVMRAGLPLEASLAHICGQWPPIAAFFEGDGRAIASG